MSEVDVDRLLYLDRVLEKEAKKMVSRQATMTGMDAIRRRLR